MLIDKTLLSGELLRLNIPVNEEALRKFSLYAEILLEWNSRVNLTAITDPDAVVYRHFADSAALLTACDVPENVSLIDVGTGAGFPAVVLKILRPDIKITLLDAQRKRTDFLRALLDSLELDGEILHFRAEEAARLAQFREAFDFATARAVADLRVLSELCIPLVRPGGYFIALKGPNIDKEFKSSENAVKMLGAEPESIKSVILGDSSGRSIILIKKISRTPTKYPRIYGKITKSPL